MWNIFFILHFRTCHMILRVQRSFADPFHLSCDSTVTSLHANCRRQVEDSPVLDDKDSVVLSPEYQLETRSFRGRKKRLSYVDRENYNDQASREI